MKQRILVLGASGFIGRQVVAGLAATDWAEPVAAQRGAAASAATTIRLDATDAESLRAALAGVSGVVNCVAGDSTTIVGGARVLFQATAAMPEKPTVVHLSTMSVYGDQTGTVDETTALGTGLSPYGAAKLQAERLARDGGRVVVLRLGIVYGPGSAQWSGRIARLLDSRRLGDLGSGGDGWCNVVYVGDVVDAVRRALREPQAAGQVLNLGLANYPSWNEYFTRYALALNAVPVKRISRRRLRIESKLLAPPLKIAEIIAGKVSRGLAARLPPPIPPSLVRLFSQEIKLKVDLAERVLGMQWTSLEQGLTQTVAYYRRTPDT